MPGSLAAQLKPARHSTWYRP